MIGRVYFHGPASNWTGKLAPGEILATIECPFLWLLRVKVRQIVKGLNAGRCGYVIHDNGVEVEHVEASDKTLVA